MEKQIKECCTKKIKVKINNTYEKNESAIIHHLSSMDRHRCPESISLSKLGRMTSTSNGPTHF